ncbi:MAG: tetratricopeptide repeat protein [Planctomycetes bacterium]|nr:tetratricopeptide repeat protein [Planctomycetota bacterium]
MSPSATAWAQPGTPYRFVPREDLPQEIARARIFQHAVAFVGAYDEDDNAFAFTLGTFIDAETIAVPWEAFERASRITVQPLCCDESDALGVVGGGLDPGVLLLSVSLEGPLEEFAIAPVTLAPDAASATAGEIVWCGTRPIGVGETAPVGFVIAAMGEEPLISVRDLHGMGRTMQVPWDSDILMAGSPIFDAEDRMLGLTVGQGGHGTSLAVPTDRIEAIERHTPIPASEYAERALLPNEESERMAGLGRLYRQLSEDEKAIEAFRAAAELDDRQWRARFGLGISLDETGQSADALEPLYESVQIEPRFAESLYSLGIVLYKLGAMPAAIHYYKRALQLAPDYASAHVNLTAAYFHSDHLKLASHHAHLAAELAPSRVDLARTADGIQGSLDDVLAQLDEQRDIVIRPDATADDWITLARGQYAVDEYEQCLEALERGFGLSPQQEQLVYARMMQIMCLIEMERYAEAQDIAKRLAAESPDFAAVGDPVLFINAQIDLARGDLGGLIAELKAVSDRDP